MENKEKILEVENLGVSFHTYAGEVKAVRGVSFHVNRGETLAFVGESGCGKTATAKAIMRLWNPPFVEIKSDSSMKYNGEEIMDMDNKQLQSLRGNKISMIFQDPMTSLNPTMTVGKQIMEGLILHQGMDKKQAREAALEMLKMVKIPAPEKNIDSYPHQLSGGMRQRVMIAMALANKPSILIADEPTTALDVTIQAQILDLMRNLQKDMGTAISFITHDLGVVSEMCDRVIVLYCGEVMEEALIDDIFENPKHPYTSGLMSTLPKFDQPGKLPTIPGTVPPSGKYPEGCVFAPRCPHATEQCVACKPPRVDLGNGHAVRCFLYAKEEEGTVNE